MSIQYRAATRWALETKVSIDRRSFERAIKALGKIDAIALIRDAYSCNIQEAKELLEILRKRE